MKMFNVLSLFLLAPIIGFFLAYSHSNPWQFTSEAMMVQTEDPKSKIVNITKDIKQANETLIETKQNLNKILQEAKENKQSLESQREQIDLLVKNSKQQQRKSDIVLEQILSNLLGEPIKKHVGKNSTIKVYSLNEAGYRGYMAKVRVHNSNALKVVLADDKVRSNGETTSDAAKRTNAILAVNAGGFWKTSEGQIAPLGITVVDSEIKTFNVHPKLSFVGFNHKGHLVGGKIKTKQELQNMNVTQGASFVPTLLQNGKKVNIPSDWANARHPRTIVGNFSNGELLFIVIDGRREGWSKGVTLEELQHKLLSFKIKDAFNLDGGGSSAFYYNGKILNRPSDGRERPVTSNIVILP